MKADYYRVELKLKVTRGSADADMTSIDATLMHNLICQSFLILGNVFGA